MPATAQHKSLDELILGDAVTLEDLVDRAALGELVQSFFELYRIPLKIFSETGTLLADASEQSALYAYVGSLPSGRRALAELVGTIKNINPGRDGEVSHPCFTGAAYRISAISYDSRRIGRMILGPFVPHGLDGVPDSLRTIDPDLDPEQAFALLRQMPRAREETVAQIASHLKRTLDLILFSGHRALLTTNMHLAAVRESYRELQEKNTKLQGAYDRLKELDRLKSNFLATVSHELRTPLTSIIGYSEMLSEGIAGDMTDEQREFVRTIHEKGEQLLELIKGLLDLSKLESGTMSLRKKNLDVAPIVSDVVSTLGPAARKKGVELVTYSEPGLPQLWADPERVRQILLNLTENAIKFTPEGGQVVVSLDATTMEAQIDQEGTGLVLLAARRPAIEIRVADTGIGIPVTERQRVFDAFYQVDSSSTREQGGTGLGLSIVKRLVEAHDGSVEIEDNTPKGSVFVVTLPCRRATIS